MSIDKKTILQAYKDGKIVDKITLEVFLMVEELKQKIDEELPHIKNIIERMKGDQGEPGWSPSETELLAMIVPLIPEAPKDGVSPTKEELLQLIQPLIPQVQDGITPTKEDLLQLIEPLIPNFDKLIPGVFQQIRDVVEKGLPMLGTAIRDGLELLQGEERLDVSAIKGIDEKLKQVKVENTGLNGGGVVGGDYKYVKYHGGASNITVATSQPGSPELYDLWVDIS